MKLKFTALLPVAKLKASGLNHRCAKESTVRGVMPSQILTANARIRTIQIRMLEM